MNDFKLLNKRIFFYFILAIFIGLSSLFVKISQKPKQSVYGQNNYSFYIRKPNSGYSHGGIIPISSEDNSLIEIKSASYNGNVQVNLFRASQKELFEFLAHDNENKQIGPDFDYDTLELVSSNEEKISKSGNTISLPLEKSAIYIVQVKKNETSIEAVIVRSNTGVIVKETDNEFVFWGQEFQSGQRISSGTITLYSFLGQAKELASSSFNENGIAKTPFLEEADIGLVEHEGDLSIVPINLNYLNISYSYQKFEQEEHTRYFVFTDRPIYKPGDTVYFKAVLRNDNDVRYTIPEGQVKATIYRGWGDNKTIFYEEDLSISSSGTVNGKHTLKETIKSGQVSLKIELPGESSSGWWQGNSNTTSFKVEHYRKPEYTINLETEENEYIAGRQINFNIKGNYFFGQPLSGKEVSYKITANDIYQPSFVPTYQRELSDEYRYGWHGHGVEIKEEKVALDKEGQTKVRVQSKIPEKYSGSNNVYSIETEYQDETGDPVFDRKNILVYAGEFNIYRSDDYRYHYPKGEEIELPLVLIPNLNSQLKAGTDLKAEVTREYWVKETNPKTKYPTYEKKEQKLPSWETKTNQDNQASFSFTPQESGRYIVSVKAKDGRGNLIKKEFNFWVSDQSSLNYYNQQNEIKIFADKEKYVPGDTANLTIISELKDRDLFLSLEREYLNRFKVIHLKGSTANVQIPILTTDMPNIFAAVNGFTKENYIHASENLSVFAEEQRMRVNLIPDKEVYRPGDKVDLDILTTDNSGQPVPANLAVWAVDKAIYELASSPKDIFEQFWKERYNYTADSHSLRGIFDHGAEGGGGGEEGGNYRDTFEDTAYWNPEVYTNNQGSASLTFDLPDNLTTWIIQSAGATLDTKVGQELIEITVTKDLIVRPVMPNLIRVGDEVNISALIHNYTNENQILDVSLDNDNVEFITGRTHRNVNIKPGEQKQVFWKINAHQPAETAKFTFEATTGGKNPSWQDTIVKEIPIELAGFWDKSAKFANKPTTFEIDLDESADLEKSSVILNLAPNLMGTLPSAMRYLVRYPYGCAEQISSQMAAGLTAKKYSKAFGQLLESRDIDQIIEKGIKKLTETQQDNGGWSWWSSKYSSPFVTSYVIEQLVLARELGYDVDEKVFTQAKSFLENPKSYNQETNQYIPATNEQKIASQYGLSLIFPGQHNPEIIDFENFSTDIVALAIITNLNNGYSGQQGLDKLKSMAEFQAEEAFWQAGSKQNFGSIEASTALAVRVLIKSGENDLSTKGMHYLLNRRKNRFWGNTFGTSEVIKAAVEYSDKFGQITPNYNYQVELNNEVIKQGLMDKVDQNIEINISKINPERKSVIEITKTGEGNIYSSLIIDQFRTDKTASKVSNGLEISKEYISEKGENYSLAVGDKVRVNITVNWQNNDQNYAVIHDQLPAGLIPINTTLKNAQYSQEELDYHWGSALHTNNNGATISLYRIDNQTTTYTYLARAILSGNYETPPISGELMYSPSVYGRSDYSTVKVTEDSNQLYAPKENKPKLTDQKNQVSIGLLVIFGLLFLTPVVYLIYKRVKPAPKSASNHENDQQI